jgi:hypothetical protein
MARAANEPRWETRARAPRARVTKTLAELNELAALTALVIVTRPLAVATLKPWFFWFSIETAPVPFVTVIIPFTEAKDLASTAKVSPCRTSV